MANKFVQLATRFAWVVSPWRGQYFVPPVTDLMALGWLPSAQRAAFVAGRTLAAAGVRYWDLGAWLDTAGLVLPAPLLVTDLSTDDRAMVEPVDAALLNATVVVPQLPLAPGAVDRAWARVAVAAPERPRTTWPGFKAENDLDRFEYVAGPALADDAWAIALCAALGLPRLGELLPRWIAQAAEKTGSRGGRRAVVAAVRTHLRGLGRPQPNNAKARAAASKPPFLLVPAWLWDELEWAEQAGRFDPDHILAQIERGRADG